MSAETTIFSLRGKLHSLFTMRSWDMVVRYVVPEINGYLVGLRQSQHFVATNRGVFDRAKEAIMVAALAVTKSGEAG
jgi:limonene 1,2-monooxygenase